MHDEDRRRHPRFQIDQPGKIFDRRSRKYISCLAVNVSRGGALIEMRHRIPASQGVHLLLGIGTAMRGAGLLRHEEMMEVEVVRALNFGSDRQFLAVRFVHAHDVAINPMLAAA